MSTDLGTDRDPILRVTPQGFRSSSEFHNTLVVVRTVLPFVIEPLPGNLKKARVARGHTSTPFGSKSRTRCPGPDPEWRGGTTEGAVRVRTCLGTRPLRTRLEGPG